MEDYYVNTKWLGCVPWKEVDGDDADELNDFECEGSVKGWMQLLFLLVVYGYILLTASDMIGDGAEMLMLVPSLSGIVGSIVLPVLGAVPDGAIVLFSGLGPDAQEQLDVGIGALAGSTVMLLTIPWVLSIKAGAVNTDKTTGNPIYKRPRNVPKAAWEKLTEGNDAFGSSAAGISLGEATKSSAKMMGITTLPFFIIQLPAFFIKVDDDDDGRTNEAMAQSPYALVGAICSLLMFFAYLYLKYVESQKEGSEENDRVKDLADTVAIKSLNSGAVSLRGLLQPELELIRKQTGQSKMVGLLQEEHLQKGASGHDTIVVDSGMSKRIRSIVTPFFQKYDKDKSNSLEIAELDILLTDLGEKASKTKLEQLFSRLDVDDSKAISLDEFISGVFILLEETDIGGGDAPGFNEDGEEDDEEDDEEEEDEIPEDLVGLSPEEQQKAILRRSFSKMGLGVFLLLLFCDPMCDVLSVIGDWLGISAFYVSFVIAPLASNASELIAAYKFAKAKTSKTAEVALAGLLGAGVMNNTFCLFIFLVLVYAKKLYWTYGAETLTILFIEAVMYCYAHKKNNTMLDAIFIGALFPGAIAIVAILEEGFGMT